MPSYYYISVDIETSGPFPRKYDMLSIGACAVADINQTFYSEIKPQFLQGKEEALKVSGLSLEKLSKSGENPVDAMQRFSAWVSSVTPNEKNPLFVAFNASFDWMFIEDYFQRYLGKNPFGYKSLDIKSFYMGLRGVKFSETSYRYIVEELGIKKILTHNALDDALDQANVFNHLLSEKEII